MASSSSSTLPTKGWTYDVFLSFKGEDTRYSFVDHLYTALVQRGIRVFKDDNTLHTGKPIGSELLKAIEESRFAVVVFSENYGNSSWCLEELAKVMECHDQIGQEVLPVFYYVDPSDVRGQKNAFATAFQKHEEKFMEEVDKVIKWRKALTAAANLLGSHISKTLKEGESKVITKIVKEILGAIQHRGLEKDLVDIYSRIDELNKYLDMEATEEVRMVGIYGMGGIGKTTIAHTLFRRIAYTFEGASFVRDIRERYNSRSINICPLQEQILQDILATCYEFKFQNPEDGSCIIQERCCNMKVLLVLDDVDNFKQLKFLAASHDWFGPGSRIIITTRDGYLLSDANAKYKPTVLREDQAVELFSRHAFQKNYPPHGYEELSYRAIRYTGFLPLALKVTGSFFHGKKAHVLESALERLAKSPNSEIFETLKLSFDGLEDSEKKIFLDVACFFKGEDDWHVTRVLNSFDFDPVVGISALIEKSLITVTNGKLEMHDLIQEMGWQIVRESFPGTRLWRTEQIQDFIQKKNESKAIQAIVVPKMQSDDEKLALGADVLESMVNLRLLDVNRKFTSSEPTFLPYELRWLSWMEYPFCSLPVADSSKLVGLQMAEGGIKQLWEGRKNLPYLKFIQLDRLRRLTKFPDVSGAPNLETLILSDCTSLVEVHESLGSHNKLVDLYMGGCQSLERLPTRIDMISLETLDLSNCSNLRRFPEVSTCMVNLLDINLEGCRGISELPSSIRYLSNLSFLNLTNCTNLANITDSVCKLKNLRSLHLHNCKELQNLPEELGSMENLEELRLGFTDYYTHSFRSLTQSIRFDTVTNFCFLKKLDLSWRQIKEEDFPENHQAFHALEELHLTGNHGLIRLPSIIFHLSSLKHLELDECSQLQTLEALPSGIQVLGKPLQSSKKD